MKPIRRIRKAVPADKEAQGKAGNKARPACGCGCKPPPRKTA